MTKQEFFKELDYCYAQLNQVTIETHINVVTGEIFRVKRKKPITEKDIAIVKNKLRELLTVAIKEGWYKITN